MVIRPEGRRAPKEQVSGTEDGVAVFGSDGVCRFDLKSGGASIGAFFVTSTDPSAPFQASRDYWYWLAEASPFPDVFELHHAPSRPTPSETPDIRMEVLFVAESDNHDLSASSLAVWRVRRGHLVQQTPVYTDLGWFARTSNGTPAWYADATPSGGFFGLPPGTWLRLVRISNTNLSVEAVHGTPGAIS